MIHTSITRNWTVFLLRRELTQSAILWSLNFDSTKLLTLFLRGVKRRAISRHVCVFHYILLLNYLPNHTYFSKHNSTDPKQRVPLMALDTGNELIQQFCIAKNKDWSYFVHTEGLYWVANDDVWVATDTFWIAFCSAIQGKSLPETPLIIVKDQ